MNNPCILLKVPEQSFFRCNQQKKLNDYIFWLKVKSLSIDGAFKPKHFTYIADQLHLSISMVRKYIKRLLDLEWIVKQEESYQLISYNRLWVQLGYDVRDLGITDYLIFKVKVTELSQLRLSIIKEEIKTNFLKQKTSILKKELKNVVLLSDSEKMQEKLCKNVKKRIDQIIKSGWKNQLNIIRKHIQPLINYDVTLSCEGLAKLLGYNTAMSGWSIEQELKNNCLAKITNRVLLVAKDISYQIYSSLDLPNSFFYKDGSLYKQLPNLITLL